MDNKELLDKLNKVIEEHFKNHKFELVKESSRLAFEAVNREDISLTYSFNLKRLGCDNHTISIYEEVKTNKE